MTQELTFGIMLLQNRPWSTLLERAREVEALGFDSIWNADQFLNYYNPQQDWFEGWSMLTGLAALTTKIRLGQLVTQIPLRNPALLARQILTVDHISGGRLNVGLGTGVAEDTSRHMVGLPDWPRGELVARFREYVEIVDRLLSNEVTTYEGIYYQINGAVMSPAPLQRPHPPITIAATGPVMLKIAARYADTWNTFGLLDGDPEAVENALREQSARIDEACADLGRDPRTLRRSLIVYRWAGNPLASTAAFEDLVEHYRQIGFSEFIFYYPDANRFDHTPTDQASTFERIAREVIPGLRQH